MDSDNATWWVEVADDLSSVNRTIYVYYGNAAASSVSNGTNTFLLFDHFDDGSIDPMWDTGQTPTESGTELLINLAGEYIRSNSSYFFQYKAMRIRAKFASASADNDYQYFGFQDSPAAGVLDEEMIFTYDTPDVKTWSGDSSNSESTSIYAAAMLGNYKIYDIMWASGEAKFYYEDSLVDTDTTYVCDTTEPVGVYNRLTSADFYVDWVFVRNYVSPEPSHGGWGSEETEAVTTYTRLMNASYSITDSLDREIIFNRDFTEQIDYDANLEKGTTTFNRMLTETYNIVATLIREGLGLTIWFYTGIEAISVNGTSISNGTSINIPENQIAQILSNLSGGYSFSRYQYDSTHLHDNPYDHNMTSSVTIHAYAIRDFTGAGLVILVVLIAMPLGIMLFASRRK